MDGDDWLVDCIDCVRRGTYGGGATALTEEARRHSPDGAPGKLKQSQTLCPGRPLRRRLCPRTGLLSNGRPAAPVARLGRLPGRSVPQGQSQRLRAANLRRR
eukprot:7376785-Prymnesium_polylepis.1